MTYPIVLRAEGGRDSPADRLLAICMAFFLCVGLVLPAGEAAGQTRPATSPVGIAVPSGDGETTIDLETLAPEGVDRLLSGLTDAEIRAILREELLRDAEARIATAEEQLGPLEQFELRLRAMIERISTRVVRWQGALLNISDRLPRVEERLARAEGGVGGLLFSAALIVVSALIAAFAVIKMTELWGQALRQAPENPSYWDRVVRTLTLTVIELLPVVAFVGVVRLIAPMVTSGLGPLVNYVWIFHSGISSAWGIIVISRRIFAPDSPDIRIAPLSDHAVASLHLRLRAGIIIGAGGWLLAGLSPTLGFGFPPALVIVWLSGTIVAVMLIWSVVRHRKAIEAACCAFLSPGVAVEMSAARRILAQTVPVLMVLYLLGAYLYWAGHWLERGRHELHGPVGTLFVLLVLPALDRVGRELALTLTGRGPRAQRYAEVFHRAWRILLAGAALSVILRLWGFRLIDLAFGPERVGWVHSLWIIAVTLLLSHLVWGLITATFRQERRASGGEDLEDGGGIEAASRLDTLIPLFRTMLLAVVLTVTAMILLSSLGVDIGPLLASAGIIGIAIGFGAQTLVRDIFSGMFFLIDDALRVGEYIELDKDLRGEVEAISIRSLQLRHHRGPVVTIPFGELKSVTNHNRDWVIYKMNFRMEPDTDPQKVKKIVKKVGAELMEHPDHGAKFIEPLKSQGVLMIDDDSALVMRVKFKCRPRQQFVLRREVYHAIQKAFAENDLHLARRKVEVVATGGEDDEELAGKAAAALQSDPPPGGQGGGGAPPR